MKLYSSVNVKIIIFEVFANEGTNAPKYAILRGVKMA